jgi:hypothetical protein
MACLFLTFIGQVNISPASEAIFAIPGGFTMAHEDNLVH